MTAPDRAAVEIAAHYFPFSPSGVSDARAVVAALDAAGWLYDPAYVAALEAVVEVSRIAVSSAWGHTDRAALADALAQLASAAETGSGEA